MATTPMDRLNWSGYEHCSSSWRVMSLERQALIDSVWQGYNKAPVGLEEMSENDWWHWFMTYMPLLSFNLQVERRGKCPLSMRVFMYSDGSGLAVSWEYSYKEDAKPVYYRVGCHHEWQEVYATYGGEHLDKCTKCGCERYRDSSG